MIRRRALAGALALGLALATAPVAAFAADDDDPAWVEGSVPAEVSAFVREGLVAELADVYGPGAGGEGIDFDESTKTGAIERVHVFSAAFLAGDREASPIELTNEWTVPISLGDDPVGVAVVWINPDSVRAELGSFESDADAAAALGDLPEGAALVRDAAHAAWFALARDGVLTPLVPGTTGLSTPVPLDGIAIIPPTPSPAQSGDAGDGVLLAAGVLVVLLGVTLAALALPRRRRRRDADAEDAVEDAGEETPAAEDPAALP